MDGSLTESNMRNAPDKLKLSGPRATLVVLFLVNAARLVVCLFVEGSSKHATSTIVCKAILR